MVIFKSSWCYQDPTYFPIYSAVLQQITEQEILKVMEGIFLFEKLLSY